MSEGVPVADGELPEGRGGQAPAQDAGRSSLQADLFSALSPYEGRGLRIERDAPLGRRTTLRVGGSADLLIVAETAAALQALVRAVHEHGAPLVVLGQGSNVLVPDEGLRGVVCQLAGEHEAIEFAGDLVTAGGAVVLARLARAAAKRGLRGLEALAGFPATVGGAVYMNAGCYGTEIQEVLERVEVLERTGERRTYRKDELAAGYRSTVLQERGALVLAATFRLSAADAAATLERMDELNRRRRASLPSGRPNAGSVFKNPPGDYAGRLIDAAGLKGTRVGGAAISEQHGNVIVNEQAATARDVLALMALVRDLVRERFGVELEPELQLLGSLRGEWNGAERCR